LACVLLELIPSGAKRDLSAAHAKAALAKVRPRDAADKARRRVAAELISDLERIYHVRHRLSRNGNRQINRVLHIVATVQLRTPPKDAPTATARSRRQDLDLHFADPRFRPCAAGYERQRRAPFGRRPGGLPG
jgi:hypothetical protein